MQLLENCFLEDHRIFAPLLCGRKRFCAVDQNRQRERKKRLKKREDDQSDGDDDHSSDDDDHHESGTGILEFSPDKAGMDITPANYDFSHTPEPKDKRHSGTLAGIAGTFPLCMLLFRVTCNEGNLLALCAWASKVSV